MLASHQRQWIAAVVLAIGASCGPGCSNLKVSKVPLADREAHVDKQHGFRYYLNRPYLAVKEHVLIGERHSLVRVDLAVVAPGSLAGSAELPNPANDPSQFQLTFLTGPRRGQSMPLSDLHVETPASGAMRAVSPAELEKLGMILAGAKAGASTPPPAVPPLPPSPPVVAGVGDTTVVLSTGQPGSGGGRTEADTAGVPATVYAATSADTTDLNRPDIKPANASATLQGKMEILYLPDLDEQYVIKSENILAKSAFGLAFKNGCELTEVQGEHDATTLTLSILEQIQAAIATAQGVEQARIQQQGRIQAAQTHRGGLTGAFDLAEAKAQGQSPVWQLIERIWIKPGVYRLNKPWEVQEGSDVKPVGCGLLAKLGLPTVVDVDFSQVSTIKLPPKPPSKP